MATVKKFDPKQPHGIVYNHLSGKYEQNGVIYGANGLPVDGAQLEEDEEKLAAEVKANDEARARELAKRA